jgi:alkaline phosphatase D
LIVFDPAILVNLLFPNQLGIIMDIKKISLAGLALASLATYGTSRADAAEAPTHGVAVGEVTANSAIIWSRANREGKMHVLIKDWHFKDQHAGPAVAHKTFTVKAADDFTGKLSFSGLRPDTVYEYRVWFNDGDEREESGEGLKKEDLSKFTEGMFRTAPAPHEAKRVSFAFGGDLAGQNTCRDEKEGFPIFAAINTMRPDFFIGLGDMIYADGVCDAIGRYGNKQIPGGFTQAFDLPSFWAHWKYNREDSGYRALLAKTPYYAIWDDHEAVNDFGPLHDTRTAAPYTPGEHLLPLGLKAFLDYNPIMEKADNPKRIYRNIRWGQHVELFILDTRQYRDANFSADSKTQPKTMLGREQLEWLKEKMKASSATWKIVVSSVPMSIPTGSASTAGRDGWANFQEAGGFEHELTDILKFMKDNKMHNNLWITTDVHFAAAFRYTPFQDDPSFQVHELVSGPLNAGVFPNRNFDTTLGTESLFFFGANAASDVSTWKQAKSWMNFGAVEVSEDGALTLSVRDIVGNAVYENTLLPK